MRLGCNFISVPLYVPDKLWAPQYLQKSMVDVGVGPCSTFSKLHVPVLAFLGLTSDQTQGYAGNRVGLYGISTVEKGKIQDLAGIGD